MTKTTTTQREPSTAFDARIAAYQKQPGVRRVYIELDPAFCNERFVQMPAYLVPYALEVNGGSLGFRFSEQKQPGCLTLQHDVRKGLWKIEFHGDPDGRHADLFRALGRAEYGVSPTEARYFPQSGVLRVKPPKTKDRVAPQYRRTDEPSPQGELDLEGEA